MVLFLSHQTWIAFKLLFMLNTTHIVYILCIITSAIKSAPLLMRIMKLECKDWLSISNFIINPGCLFTVFNQLEITKLGIVSL